jgi:hypothetical protein
VFFRASRSATRNLVTWLRCHRPPSPSLPRIDQLLTLIAGTERELLRIITGLDHHADLARRPPTVARMPPVYVACSLGISSTVQLADRSR